MARYYQTADPQFVDNFIYTPPYELMLQVANQKQVQYDQAISTAKLLGDIKVDHLNGEYDTANVLEKQRYYNDRANSIIEGIRKDPLNVNGYIGEIDNLQKELKTDFTSGEISKFVGSKAAYTKWEEQNKERLKDSPARYEAARNAFFKNWGGNSLDSQWKGELITQDVDWNKIYDAAEKIKASEYTEEKAGPSGGYIWKNKTTNEKVTEEELMNNILGRVLTPDNLASLQQSERIGVGKYFKEDGTPDITYDEKGKIVSSAPGWIPSRLFANSAAYSVHKQESDVQSDGTAMTYVREAGANNRQQAGFAHAEKMKQWDFEYDRIKETNKNKEAKIDALDMKIAEAQIAGDDKAVTYWENAKNNITGNTGIFNSKAGSVYDDIGELQKRSVAGDKVAQKHIDQTFIPMLKEAGINFSNPEEKKIAEEMVGLVKQNKLNVNDIGTYMAKRIPTKYPKASQDEILLRAKAMKADDDRVNTLFMRTSKNKPLTSYVKEAEKSVMEGKGDVNNNYREVLTKKFKTAFNSWGKDWQENKSNFSTTYDVIPLDIRGQSTVKSQLRDPEIADNVFIEKDGKREPYSSSGIILQNITGMVGIDGNREHGIIGTDANGKQYKLSGDSDNPIFKSLLNNTAKSINPNTPVGYQIKYPTVNRLAQIIQGSKRVGNNNIRQSINVKGQDYTIIVQGQNVQAIDSKGNMVIKNPTNYIEAGIALENITK